ncbi:interaptin-like [Mercenaria mercenaria]|uniref:interaptin-like n=1 Tax=Mercenaria mercenaria TaxID=6596 RepID=UPI00234EDD88|nr:interaptin-like [Mercenaria mercenaria]
MPPLGPFCQSSGITTELLETGKFPLLASLTNGLVLELKHYADSKSFTLQQFVDLLSRLSPMFSAAKSVTSVYNRVNTLKEQKRKLHSKKKVKGVKNVTELLNKEFHVTASVISTEQTELSSNFNSEAEVCNDVHPASEKHKTESLQKTDISVQTDGNPDDDAKTTKKWNMKKYLCNKQTRQLRKIQKQIREHEQKMQKISSRTGHYSVKNVNKRDENSRKNSLLLRKSSSKVRAQQFKIKKLSEKNVLTERRLKEIQEEYDALTVQNENLKDINRSLKELSQSEKDKKVLAQKSNSYLRKEISDLRTNLKQCVDSDFLLESSSHEICNNSIKQMKLLLDEKEQQINELQEEAIEKKKIDTRNANGCFTDNVRLCVMELAALEVATEKVSKVIQCVSSHLHNYSLKNDELPNSTTVQTIVDEGTS